MYNGVGSAGTTKGTGRSGYVQRNKANNNNNNNSFYHEFSSISNTPTPYNNNNNNNNNNINYLSPLEKRRTPEDNERMATRLAEHKELRRIEMRIISYEEEQYNNNNNYLINNNNNNNNIKSPEQISSEVRELRKKLMSHHELNRVSKMVATASGDLNNNNNNN
eukprot:Tbor_TRINITY_DN5423_c1_g1::TRINITY_DN5423_c1_g1_i14::g.25562::m.25562